MIRYLLDKGAAGDYVGRRHGVRERASDAASRGHRVGVALPVLAELWYGIEFSSSREKNADRLRRALPTLFVWPLTVSATEVYGQIAAELRRLGRPIGKINMLIAAIAISLGNTIVVSVDKDLRVVPRLTVENWCDP